MDAGLVLGQLAEATGVRLADGGACPGGHAGARYVRWPGGRRSVLTTAPAGTGAEARRVASLLAAGRAHRVPAPRYELVADLPSAVAIVQELLPGSVPAVPGRRAIESMIEVNQRCRGILAGRDDLPAASLYLRADGPGYCLHEPLARFDLARRAPELGQWLAGQLHGAAPDDVAAACWAHMSLRLVDWSIRHYPPSYVTTWLEVADALRPA
jgi:hypothetical protein